MCSLYILRALNREDIFLHILYTLTLFQSQCAQCSKLGTFHSTLEATSLQYSSLTVTVFKGERERKSMSPDRRRSPPLLFAAGCSCSLAVAADSEQTAGSSSWQADVLCSLLGPVACCWGVMRSSATLAGLCSHMLCRPAGERASCVIWTLMVVNPHTVWECLHVDLCIAMYPKLFAEVVQLLLHS